jgi:hypothetical protein
MHAIFRYCVFRTFIKKLFQKCFVKSWVSLWEKRDVPNSDSVLVYLYFLGTQLMILK